MILRRSRSRTLVVIPARHASTRLPGKVLKPLGGIPVVEWVRRSAIRADRGPVVVATDHPDVLHAVERFGGSAVLTSERCSSGTDRVAEALRIVEAARGLRFRAVINLQGDEPFIRPATIRRVAALIEKGADISTAVVPLSSRRAAADPNVVKAAVAADGRCLYFSRSAIPFANGVDRRLSFRHIGIYGFTREALRRFVRLRPSPLERAERLEQLRALEDGMTIVAARVADPGIAIDTPADLARARRRCRGRTKTHG
ncbi:MAG: 3-deoxy-manno-octulosonate cytidylyltransferase [Elusimicrobiota bacterium]